jgi:deazaflavin-dependent oxidoreductase (nitroreductase family)
MVASATTTRDQETNRTMDDQVTRALRHGQTIDITTTGRRTGQPRRIEIVDHVIDGRIFITGMPRADRKRAWLLNLEADPRLTIHLKGPVVADVPATARVLTDPGERQSLAAWVATNAWRNQDPAVMTAYSPMIEVTPEDIAA